jgi:hypothetical protein
MEEKGPVRQALGVNPQLKTSKATDRENGAMSYEGSALFHAGLLKT